MHPINIEIMAKKTNTRNTAIVQLYERELKSGAIRFYLHYTIDGQQTREALKSIPIVKKDDKQAYKEAKCKAQAIAFERTAEIRNGQIGITSGNTKILLYDWILHCADQAEKRSTEVQNRHTWGRMLRQTAAVLVEYAGAQVKLTDVDKDFAKGFIEYLQNTYTIKKDPNQKGGVKNEGQHLAPKSAQKKYTCLHFALNEAVRDELIPRNPCNLIAKTDKIKVPESTREYLTEEELKKLEATPTESAVRNVYLFMCCCGLRISDTKGLRWSDIEKDGERWRLRIRQQKTKTPLYLPLSDTARAYLPARGEQAPSDLVFADLPTEPALNRALKRWAAAAEINKTLTLHTARHTFATLMLTKGADLYTTSKLLGHTEVGTTQIYAKIIDKKKEDAVDLLNNIF